jgi:hypothetical protein
VDVLVGRFVYRISHVDVDLIYPMVKYNMERMGDVVIEPRNCETEMVGARYRSE